MKSIFKTVVAAILQWEARRVLGKYRPSVVAVTGSVGKTSSKDAIYKALEPFFFIRKSERSFNSEIGIPLTILGRPNAWYNPLGWLRNFLEGLSLLVFKYPYPRWLVLEVGADRPGDIQKIAGWLQPDTVVVTRLPDVPVHVEFFGSPQEVIEEKSYLPRALRPGGFLLLNADDEQVLRFRSVAHEPRVITYGFGPGAELRASGMRVMYEEGKPTGVMFRVDYHGSSVPMRLRGVLGTPPVYAVLAGLGVGATQKINLVDMGQHFLSYVPTPGRMRIIEGAYETTIIDDSYNSSPAAAQEALKVLHELQVSGKRVAVLGDMLELGQYSAEEHRRIGALAADAADMLVAVGLRSRYTAEAARKAGLRKKQVLSFDTAEEATDALVPILERGDVVLVKGSQAVRLERVVVRLMAQPEHKHELLVRQDEAWQRR